MAQNNDTKILPGKFHIRWLWIYLWNAAVLWALMVAPRIWILHSRFSLKNYGAYLVLASILALLPGIAGFFSLETLFWFGTAGNLSGLIIMLTFLIRGGGWEDITSLLVLIEFSLLGFIIGVLLETVLWLRRRVRRRSD